MAREIWKRLPPEVDATSIRQAWQALQGLYEINDRHLPQPVWARRPFTDSGPEAWQALRQDAAVANPERQVCIYIHLPFCAERCSFCDCYAIRLGAHRQEHVAGYLDLLTLEMQTWAGLEGLAARPVSTVHLGGGTPTFLSIGELARLVQGCRRHFAAGDATEWALESTAAELTPEVLDGLDSLGFTRLHVGVQSLEDSVRRSLHRRLRSQRVIKTLERAIGRGWVVSVDLIVGLPGQTIEGLVADVRQLVDLGVNGFSLYELQISPRNRPFALAHSLENRDRLPAYIQVQIASQLLQSLGYRKTLFNHFADDRDTNLYFTFPERGEDCLALGTVADGSFGDYHYRHPEYAAYRRAVTAGFPGLEGGLRRSTQENHLHRLTTALLAGRVPAALLDTLGSRGLLERWRAAGLLEEQAGGTLHLTGNGSWFVGNMIGEMLALTAK